MYSLKYGTVPIVRKTGGLADTVQQFDPETLEGTGFVFEHYTSEGVRWAIDFALDVFADRKAWLKLMRNGMSKDFSWGTQVERYIELYQDLAQG
jgi:starch synthase